MKPPHGSTTQTTTRRILITAGPTHEPIDRVRFLGNRSSGKLGIEMARAAYSRGCPTTLLLGPGIPDPVLEGVSLLRFRTHADLEKLLTEQFPQCDTLIMAAAVADYRPKPHPEAQTGKIRRVDKGQPLTIELEPTTDLLAQVAAGRKPGQHLVGFALEPEATLEQSARDKLARKKVDAIIANPLETMDSDRIDATMLLATSSGTESRAPGALSKREFAGWLIDQLLGINAETGQE